MAASNVSQWIVWIDSAIKGRHASGTIECMPVYPEPNNPIDKKAFTVMSNCSVYGRVPKGLQDLFHNVGRVLGRSDAILCKPSLEKDIASTDPRRWNRGGGLEQPCQYGIKCDEGVLMTIKCQLKDMGVQYQLEKIEHH